MEWQKIFNSFLEYVKLKTTPLLEENADLSVISCTMHKYSDNDKNYSYRTEAVIALLFSDVHDDHHKKLIETALLAEMRYCYMAWGCSNSLRILAGLLWDYDKESPRENRGAESSTLSVELSAPQETELFGYNAVITFKNNGKRSIIKQFNFHICSENTILNIFYILSALFGEVLV